MTVTTGATRELVEQLSTEHPEFRYEISATGLVEMDVTPPQGRHGSFVADLSAWLVTRYGRGRAATEVGVATTGNPEPYRQVDLALFRARVPGEVRYHDPAGIALVIEVLSTSTAEVDHGEKYTEYEAAGIANYWIADPSRDTVQMWRLTPTGYVPAGTIDLDTLLDTDPDRWLHLEK